MRIKTLIFLLLGIFNFAVSTPAFAIISAKNTEVNSVVQNQKSASKTTIKVLKHSFSLQKRAINLNSPTDKWLWYGLGFLGLSVVMSVLPVVRGFAGLIALIGVILLIVWLIKKLGI
jgi:hypothetical protein